MKKILSVLFLLMIIMAKSVNAEQIVEYKFVPIQDSKTNIEFARTIIPKDFNVKTEIAWERNYEEPAQLSVYASSKDNAVNFFYSSAKTYVDLLSENETVYSSKKQDAAHKVFVKKYTSPDEYILEKIKTDNPQVIDIKLNYKKEFSEELINYLISNFYQKTNELTINVKNDKKASKVTITNPKVQPYIALYSYKIGKKSFKQLFVTMFTSMDYNYTYKTSYDEYKTATKKIWRNNGFYSYKSEDKFYDKYLGSFVVFIADSMINQKTKEALERTKKQMARELIPVYASGRKKMPSELFRLYYEGGAADYSESISVQIPVLDDVRWLSNYIVPQKCFHYRKMTNLWRQSLYVPEKYTNVYYNTLKETLIFSDEKQKLKGSWISLKPQKRK